MGGAALMKAEEVAEYLAVTPGALAQMRYEGTGPRFIKITGRAVRYRREDVDDWLESRIRHRTGGDAGLGNQR